MQEELSSYGIRVTAIYPGKLNTQMFKKTQIDKNMSDALPPLEVAKIIDYIINTENYVDFPEIQIRHLRV